MADPADVPRSGSGSISMWADPGWEPGTNFVEWRRAQPQHLKNVPYNQPAASNKSMRPMSPRTSSASVSGTPRLEGYLPPHLRGPYLSDGSDTKKAIKLLPPHLRCHESEPTSAAESHLPPHLRGIESEILKPQQNTQKPNHDNNSTSTGPLVPTTCFTSNTIHQGSSVIQSQSKPAASTTLTLPPLQHLQEQAFLESVGLLPRKSVIPRHLQGLEDKPRHATPKEQMLPSTLDPSLQPFRMPPVSELSHSTKPPLQEKALNRLIVKTGLPFHDPNKLSQMMISELNSKNLKDGNKDVSAHITPSSVPLAKTSDVSVPSNISLSGRISDVGIDNENRSVCYPPKEIVRAKQGTDARELFLDWDGKSWMPPPVDWENDRGTFDDSFIPEYCAEWASGVEGSGQVVDINGEGFSFGTHPISNDKLADPIQQPEVQPDLVNCENESKRRMQTAEAESYRARRRLKKQMKPQVAYQGASLPPYEPAQFVLPDTNLYRPLIDIYLRPATSKDVPGMTVVYNRYAEEGISTEDQEPVAESVIRGILPSFEQENAPVVVAIKGRLPEPIMQRGKEVIILPQFEQVIGFVSLNRHDYTFGCGHMGRSRYTSDLNIYVHPEYTRKGVGRSLMDRIFQCASSTYSAKDGYDWYNPNEHPVYKNGGGRQCHQIIAEYATFKGDPNFEWTQKFLEKFSFRKVGTIDSAGRSAPYARELKWLDVVIFQARASRAIEIYN